MSDLGAVIIVGLAAARLYRLGAVDAITSRPRLWLLSRPGKVAQWIGDLLMCPWCIGFWWCVALWLALEFTGLYDFPGIEIAMFASSLVAGAAAKLIERWL